MNKLTRQRPRHLPTLMFLVLILMLLVLSPKAKGRCSRNTNKADRRPRRSVPFKKLRILAGIYTMNPEMGSLGDPVQAKLLCPHRDHLGPRVFRPVAPTYSHLFTTHSTSQLETRLRFPKVRTRTLQPPSKSPLAQRGSLRSSCRMCYP